MYIVRWLYRQSAVSLSYATHSCAKATYLLSRKMRISAGLLSSFICYVVVRNATYVGVFHSALQHEHSVYLLWIHVQALAH